MRICFVSPHSFDRPGGVRTHILNLSKQFEDDGHKTHILVPGKGKKTPFNTNIPNLTEIGYGLTVPVTGTYTELALFTRNELKEFFSKNEFDVIHFHNFGPFISTDTLHQNKLAKKIITFHVYPVGFATKIYSPSNVLDFSRIFEHIVFVSNSQKRLYEQLKSDQFSIVPNGINFNPKEKVRSIENRRKITLLYVGRIEERKGLNYLISAFKIAKDLSKINLSLKIVGSGPMDFINKLKGSTKEDKSIEFLGRVSDEKLQKIRSSSDIYISPAIRGESFGIVLLEAMSQGIPTVAFDIDGYRSVMTGELNQCLVENENVHKLAEKIVEISNNPKLYKHLSKIGLEHSKKYDWRLVAKEIMKIYKKIVN